MAVAKVEQAALVGIGRQRVGVLEGQRCGRQQAGAMRLQRIESPGLDQGFDHALVDQLAVHARTEIEEALERAIGLALAHDGLDRPLPRALDGAQRVADRLVVDRDEAPRALVHIGRREGDAEVLRGIVVEDLELVGVVAGDAHVG